MSTSILNADTDDHSAHTDKPDLHRSHGPGGMFVFAAILLAGLLFTGYSLFGDIARSGQPMTALLPFINSQKITQSTTMQKPKKKQLPYLLHAPAVGLSKTTPSDAKDASTEARSSAPSPLPENSHPQKQIRRNQYGKYRIPKRFLISQNTCSHL